MGGDAHQVAGAAAHQIGGRQPVQLVEQRDAHFRQQPEGDIVGQPGFRPVQDAGQWCRHEQPGQQMPEGLAVLQRQHDKGAEHADTDEGGDTGDAEDEGQGHLGPPGGDQPHQDDDQLAPAQPFGSDDALGRAQCLSGGEIGGSLTRCRLRFRGIVQQNGVQ